VVLLFSFCLPKCLDVKKRISFIAIASAVLVCVQYVAVFCCLSAKEMATSRQCKVPIKEDQRLDHAAKLEASLYRSGEPALGTAQHWASIPAKLSARLIRSDRRGN
jgi:hypothetical protein